LLAVAIDSLHDHFRFGVRVFHSNDEISVFRQGEQSPHSTNLSVFQTPKIREDGFVVDGGHDLQRLPKHFNDLRRVRADKRAIGSESLENGVWNLKIHSAYAVGTLSSDIADLVQSANEICNAIFSHSLKHAIRDKTTDHGRRRFSGIQAAVPLHIFQSRIRRGTICTGRATGEATLPDDFLPRLYLTAQAASPH
jgi:hypothetical protein